MVSGAQLLATESWPAEVDRFNGVLASLSRIAFCSALPTASSAALSEAAMHSDARVLRDSDLFTGTSTVRPSAEPIPRRGEGDVVTVRGESSCKADTAADGLG